MNGICGGQSGAGTGFSTSISFFPCQYHSTIAAYSIHSFIHSFTKPITDAIECQQATASLNADAQVEAEVLCRLVSNDELSCVCTTCFPFLVWEDNFVSTMLVLISWHIAAVC
jgi:hypothetical protein